MLGTLEFLFRPCEGLLTLLQALTMPLGRGLGHLDLVHLARVDLLVNPLLSGLQRRVELLAFALLMAVGTDDLFAAIVDLECTMVDHALETVFLHLGSLSVHPWPLGRRQGRLDLRGSPVHQGLALGGFAGSKRPWIILSSRF